MDFNEPGNELYGDLPLETLGAKIGEKVNEYALDNSELTLKELEAEVRASEGMSLGEYVIKILRLNEDLRSETLEALISKMPTPLDPIIIPKPEEIISHEDEVTYRTSLMKLWNSFSWQANIPYKDKAAYAIEARVFTKKLIKFIRLNPNSIRVGNLTEENMINLKQQMGEISDFKTIGRIDDENAMSIFFENDVIGELQTINIGALLQAGYLYFDFVQDGEGNWQYCLLLGTGVIERNIYIALTDETLNAKMTKLLINSPQLLIKFLCKCLLANQGKLNHQLSNTFAKIRSRIQDRNRES